jgi:hypothetical protein
MMIGPIEGRTRVKLQASIEESIAAGLFLINKVWNNDRIYVANELFLLCWRTTVC